MAAKRQLSSLDPMIYNKLPHLETESDHAIATGLCKSNPLSGYGTDNLLGYKHAYLPYSLQNPEGSEPSHPWSPAAAYLQYAGNALNHLRTDGALIKGLCYRPGTDNLKPCLQPTGTDKGKEETVRDLLIARANFMGHQDQLRQAQTHAFPLQKPMPVNSTSTPASAGCASLAVPKPVYRNSVCFVEPGCNSGTSLSLGSQRENKQKQQMDRGWRHVTPTASGHLTHPSDDHYGTLSVRQNNPQQQESNFLPVPQSFVVHTKETGRSPMDYATFQPTLEKIRISQGSSFPETKYPTMYENQKISEMHHESPTQKAWSGLHPGTHSVLTHSKMPAFHNRSPPLYPLTSHGQTILYHPGDPLSGKQNGSVFALQQPANSYKGFSSSIGEPKTLPGSYFNQQILKNHYPNTLEHYPYRSMVPTPNGAPVHLPVESCSVKPGVTQINSELQHNLGYKQDFLQPTSNFAFASPDMASYNNAVPTPDIQYVHPGSNKMSVSSYEMPPAEGCSRGQQRSGHHSAFQPVYVAGASVNCSKKLADGVLGGETSYITNPVEVEKLNMCRQESSSFERRASLTFEELRSRKMLLQEASPMAPIVIDSPTPQHSKAEAQKYRVSRLNPLETQTTTSTSSCVHQPSKEKPKNLRNNENSSPSSPPMPVINNVFSLAPYRAYLEGSGIHPFTKDCRGAQSSEGSLKHKDENRGGIDSSQESFLNPLNIQYQETASEQPSCRTDPRVLKANIGNNGRVKSTVESKEKSSEVRPHELCQPVFVPPNLPMNQPTHEGLSVNNSVSPANIQSNKLQRENEVLDLSLKKTASNPWNQTVSGKTDPCEGQAQDHQILQEKWDSLEGQEICKESPLQPGNNTAADKNNNFHSSASFMFKKYKILKPAPVTGRTSCHDNALPEHQKVQVLMQPNPQPLLVTSFKVVLPEFSNSLTPSAPQSSPTLAEASASLPCSCESAQSSSGQYFTDLHLSLCTTISTCVSESSLELLQEWLSRTEPDGESKERPKSPNKHKNGSRILDVLKASKSREIWMYFEGVPVLLSKLLSQLETFMFIQNCPFPHVVRARAIFIPIHLVKEKLFPGLPGISVDQVLQEHKVELRPTTLSEERLLRDSELKGCSSKMLKLLALKQLPDIYPDLLDLLWHDCVRQQLGEHSKGSSEGRERVAPPLLCQKNKTAQRTVTLAKMPGPTMKEKRRKQEVVRSFCRLSAVPEETSASALEKNKAHVEKQEGLPNGKKVALPTGEVAFPGKETKSLVLKLKRILLPSCTKKGVFQSKKPSQSLRLKQTNLSLGSKIAKDYSEVGSHPSKQKVEVTVKKGTAQIARKTRSTSRVLHLRNSMVQIKFQQMVPGAQMKKCAGKSKNCSLLRKFLRPHRYYVEPPAAQLPYPKLVGKRIRHLYEENDKTEVWYQGVVLSVHKRHQNPLKTIYEVRYDSEPEWQYYLELLQDYENGWLEIVE
ncbi:uncharacterized protein C15orf39 homolog isoform X2 [Microcaecilia unicolor]|uniref:Uncharacterized protein C15orf39 homolog isoform X2 n=1 Tax=Microcaecilia unicolor TaxID=1415580 RepID=A0A6P7WXD1_9AMPH|nr:uncharacterized protein C15orf39 homolog isoform X2 [Microcaecilia unicolor]XP_030042579.1 uncharacterized protein C15orf39 homolog isoform X2 [Microcaecilia unicolor]